MHGSHQDDHNNCMIDSLTGRHVYAGTDWMANPHRRPYHGRLPYGYYDKYAYNEHKYFPDKLPEKPLGEHGPPAVCLGFWDSAVAEREYNGLSRALEEVLVQRDKKLAEVKSRQAVLQERRSTLKSVSITFTSMAGIRAPDGSAGSSQQRAFEELNSALNPYWLPEAMSLRSEWQRSCRTDKYREPWNPEYPPAQWHGNLVVQSVEQVTFRREAVFFMYCGGWGGGYWIDHHVPFSFKGRVDRYIPTGEVGTSTLEWELHAAVRFAAEQSDVPRLRLLKELSQELCALIFPLRQQVLPTFHPDLGPAEGEEQLFIHGCDYRNRRRYEKEVKSYLKWPPLTKFEAPKVGERYGLASYKGICWVCHGRWELHRFTPGQLEPLRERIRQIGRRLDEQIRQTEREEAARLDGLLHIEEEIALLRRRMDTIVTLHYRPQTYAEFWQPLEESAEQGQLAAPESTCRLQIPQVAQSRTRSEH